MGGSEPRVVAYVAAAPAFDATARAAMLPVAESVAAVSPAVLLATCHRVELYGTTSLAGAALEGTGMRRLEGEAAIRHVVETAIGLGAAVLAEDQLLHQLRMAVAAGRRGGPLPSDLDRTLDASLRAGRVARSWRPAGPAAPGRSLADAALARLAAVIGPLQGRRLLVVGAGMMGEAVLVAGRSAGARVALASRSGAHAAEIAGRHGAVVWPSDPGARLGEAEAVVVALAGPWDLEAASRRRLSRSRLAIVDLSMPPAVAVEVRASLGERYVDIDDLAVPLAAEDAAVRRYRDRLRRLADTTVASVLDEALTRATTGAAHLARRIEDQRRRELDAYLRGQPELDETTRAILDDATREVAARLFRVPLQRLAQDPSGQRRRAAEELFGS